MKVLISGGGIAGLTTAIACVQSGIEVAVFEQAQQLSEVGAGIQMGSNATRVLTALGMAKALAAVATEPPCWEMRLGEHNLNIFRTRLGRAAIENYGAPYYLLHRTDLIELLAETLEAKSPGALRLNQKVASVSQSAQQATVHMADGSDISGDVVVGADGIHSTLRRQMFGSEKPRFTGNVVWRAMLPASPRLRELLPDSMCVWAGPEKHCVTYWLRGGTVLNFVGAVEQDNWTEESWNSPGPKEEFAADFGHWNKPLSAVVDEAQSCSRWALFDRDPMPQWVDERVALVGDACHPMLPFLAQGAAMGIEDGWVLAQQLAAQSDNVFAALENYQRLRQPRTARVQKAARARMHSNHLRTFSGQLKSYGAMWLASRFRPAKFDARLNWLYRTDVTQPDATT